MKKVRILLAVMLSLLLLSSVLFFTEAEQAVEGAWQADLTKLMNPDDVPQTTEIQYRNTYAEGTNVNKRDIACEVTVNGVAYGCEFVFEVAGEPISDWSGVQAWLGEIVTEAARSSGSDSEAIAKAIDSRIQSRRRAARAQVGAELPVWAMDNFSVATIRVSTPFYPELKTGKNGEDTKRLQQRLIDLGFLSGKADGYFGPNTEAAVKSLESYIRELEQDLIDARPAATPVPTPVTTIEPVETVAVREVSRSKHQLTLVPRETAVPTPEPTAQPTPEPMAVAADAPVLEPVTRVDGVAEALLQAYLYSDEFVIARRAMQSGDTGSDVSRMQTRLAGLGCSVSAADGYYGEDTVRSLRIFQHYNGLEMTGEADMQTLAKLYSNDVTAPAHPLLTLNSSGDEVRALQTRLRELGFGNISADGGYGVSTQAAVETLQRYVRAREEAWLRDQKGIAADANVDLSKELTTEINGIADPMLLDALYSNNFPVVPNTLSSGSRGDDVVRLQRRLGGLEYIFGSYDGQYGAQTAEAVSLFQKQHKLEVTGVADQATMEVLFSGRAHKALKPYMLRVSIKDQRVYAYGLDENNEYTELVRTMKCSTGKNETPTPKGTFQATTGPGARWHYFKKFECWAQYAYYIEGDIMFHSVLYNDPDGPVTQSSVNNLGRKASHGCVRLSVEDAKWIWNNCPMKTKIIVE